MAFPTIPTTGNGRLLSQFQADTSGTRTFPDLSSLTKNSGDLLIAVAVAYQRSAAGATFSGWTGGFTELSDIDGGASTMAVGIATKVSTGSETGTFAVTQAATVTGHVGLFVMSIPGWHGTTLPVITALAVGTSTVADPAALDPAGWGTEDTLWISVAGSGETSLTGSYTGIGGGASPPTNYGNSNGTGESADVIGAIGAAVAFRQNPVASENVGTWGSVDTSNARNCAALIAVRPAAVSSAVLVTDTFTRSNSDTVGNDSNGNAWVERAGDWDISSNGVIQTDATTNPGCLLCGTDMADNTHWVEAKLAVSDGTGQIGLLVRLDPTAFTALSFEVADGAYKLIEVTAGSPNTVFTGSAHAHTTGELYAAEINTAGTITLYLNGTQVATTTSSFNLGDTRVGLHINESSSGAIRWDDFRAGVGPYPGPPAGATNADAELAAATGTALDAVAEVIWPAPILMAPMVAP